MAIFGLSYLPEVPLILSGLFLVLLVAVFILCVCHGQKEKSPDFGIPGRLSSIIVDVPPMLIEPFENGDPLKLKHEENHDPKYKTVVERALPDIPKALPGGGDTDTDQTPDSGSECYATVNKPSASERNLAYASQGSSNENQESSLPSTSVSPTSGTLPSPEQVTLRAKDAPLVPGTSQTSHEYAHVHKPHHPYARLSNQLDSDPGTDDYDESQSSDRDRNKRLKHGATTSENNGQTAVEQPKSDKDLSSPSSSTGPSVEEPRPVSSMAGQAVAGNVPSAEIPYMTPLLVLEAAGSVSQNANVQEVPYTVISVREPLERVRMQIQKLRKKQHSNQSSSLDEPEGYYMEVPDDEQTYAEIESGQNSGESSTTYDHIEPRNTLMPPDPPTVESLKSVAQAHSRQASIASMSSFGSNGEGSSSTKDCNALYSVVDKTGKKQAAQQGADSPELGNKNGQQLDYNIDDLYAKVQKKKVGGTMSVSGIEDVLRSETIGNDDVFVPVRGSWSPSPAPSVNGKHKTITTIESNNSRTIYRRHSAEPGLPAKEWCDETEPGYATVKANKEVVVSNGDKANIDINNDPGYESIRKKATESDVDPGYELIRNRSIRTAKEGSDPGYESVRNVLPTGDNISEPGYERVKHLGRTDSDVADPGYERVRRSQRRDTEPTDPDYECIKYIHRNDSDCVDPGYERVKRLARCDSDAVDPGYEPIKRLVQTIEVDETLNSFTTGNDSEQGMVSSLQQSSTLHEKRGAESQNGSNCLENNQISFSEELASDSLGFIVTGERISIRINCRDSTPQVVVPESYSENNHATNLILVGEPSSHINITDFKIIDNDLDDMRIDSQSNLDYETASSGGSTLGSRKGGAHSSKHSVENFNIKRPGSLITVSRSASINEKRIAINERENNLMLSSNENNEE